MYKARIIKQAIISIKIKKTFNSRDVEERREGKL
jgi:hypothetical protein